MKTETSVITGPLIRTVTQQGTASGYVTVSTTDASPNGHYRKTTQHGQETLAQITYDPHGRLTIQTDNRASYTCKR